MIPRRTIYDFAHTVHGADAIQDFQRWLRLPAVAEAPSGG